MEGSAIQSLEEVDKPGVRIAAIPGAAWRLWLDANIKEAEVKTLDRAVYESKEEMEKLFAAGEVDVMAGLRSGGRAHPRRALHVRAAGGGLPLGQAGRGGVP